MKHTTRLNFGGGLVAAIVCLATAAAALAQTTQPYVQPAESSDSSGATVAGDWPIVVRRFAETLAAAGDNADRLALLRPLVRSDCVTRRFDGGGGTLVDLLDRAGGGTLVSARGYVTPVSSMAADIAEDAAQCAALPEDLKRALTPQDNEATRRANATGSRWISMSLESEANQPVGVIVHWLPEPPQSDPAAAAIPGAAAAAAPKPEQRLLMILVKGQLGTDGKYRIRQAVFGTSKQATQ
jgi:hypothetical protein